MRKINQLTNEIKLGILDYLYKDEMYNSILIELIENSPKNIGELFISEDSKEITGILHIKNDGNSDFTSFHYSTDQGLKAIAEKIKGLSYKRILLAGTIEKVSALLYLLGDKRQPEQNIFYKLNTGKYKGISKNYKTKIRLAALNKEDIEKVKKFTAAFLEAETEEEARSITDDEKILPKMKSGVYLLEYEGRAIGMARFIGKTKNYAEVTSVYIDECYRSRGFGKELIGHMMNIALKENKTPVLETGHTNMAARNTYEAMGFEEKGKYAFEFLT